MADVNIVNLSVSEIEGLLRTPGTIVRGELDVLVVESVEGDNVTVSGNTYLVPQAILVATDYMLETYNIGELAKALYKIEGDLLPSRLDADYGPLDD